MSKQTNILNKTEVDELYKLKLEKNIKNVEIARGLNYANSTVNGFFNKYIGSKNCFDSIKLFIEKQEYRYSIINQEKYGKIEIDNREKDIVIIAMVEKTETNLIQIERNNIKKLIRILKKEL
jgi:hypothetical protein